MRFVTPWYLLALIPALAIVVIVARYGGRAVPRRQHRLAVALRLAAVGLLVAALAQPLLVRAVDDRAVLFLLDRSDSVSAGARELQEEIIAEALAAGRIVDRSGVAVFGTEMLVDQALSAGRTPVRVLTAVDGSATDLGGALRAAGSLLPTEGSRRIVVLTDLVETTGSAREVARQLAESGVAVDVVTLANVRSADALVESVTLAPAVREGDRVPVKISIRSTTAGPAIVTVTPGDSTPISVAVNLAEGRTEVVVEVTADRTGFLPVRVDLEAGFDTKGENDHAEGITRVLGAARVAVIEGVTGEADLLTAALEAAGLAVDRRVAIPDEATLLEYDAVLLVNVDKPSNADAAALAAYVEDLGRGLVVIGGDRSFGLGDYHLTPLEAVLPVSSNPDDLIRRQPVAQVLVIDTSGSMAACHCNSTTPDTGVNKTDLSRAGAAAAIAALADSDKVGVLSFSSGFDWVLPLAPRPGEAAVETALGELFPEGDTEIAPALREAMDALRQVPEDLRHIVLFTDGWDPNEANLLPIVREIADAGITLSVLGTGEGPGAGLQRMAEVGGGRYYPGTDLTDIPEIFVDETLTVARNLATEGSFFPVLGARSPVTENLTQSPPLLGYVLTKAKGSAAVALEIGQGDPLMATWQRGLGRVTAWTSDATSRWSADWVDWEGYVTFWGELVRDVLPAGRDNPPEVFVDGGELHIRVTDPDLADGSTAVARVRIPGGETVSVPLTRTGVDTFEGVTRAAAAGAYWAAVTVDTGDGAAYTSGSGAVSSYQEEFAFREPDPTLGADLAAVTGGRLDPPPADLFLPAPVKGRAEQPIWPWLVGIALALFLTDVALRRLVLAEGDAAEWRRGATSERRREVVRVAEVAERRREAGDSSGEVASDSETLQRLMRRKSR